MGCFTPGQKRSQNCLLNCRDMWLSSDFRLIISSWHHVSISGNRPLVKWLKDLKIRIHRFLVPGLREFNIRHWLGMDWGTDCKCLNSPSCINQGRADVNRRSICILYFTSDASFLYLSRPRVWVREWGLFSNQTAAKLAEIWVLLWDLHQHIPTHHKINMVCRRQIATHFTK